MPTATLILMPILRPNQQIGLIMTMVGKLIVLLNKLIIYSELSYLLQFMEKNGRNRGDPWSLRQTGVYQQATFDSDQSAWIFLQLSRSTRIVLENAFRSQLRRFSENDSPMTLHGLLLEATVDNWGEYIQDLNAQLRDVVRDLCVLISSNSSFTNYWK
jgi:hypothetical protein